MSRIQDLEQKVYALYATKNAARADWADWLGDEHVPVVAKHASLLAKRFGANEEFARAAALLHDIADATMSRFADGHEEKSLEIARDLLQQSGFDQDEIKLIVDDAIRFHSCHNGKIPESLEGKVLATADAIAHLQTDFYIFATWDMGKTRTLHETKAWVLKKIERDFTNKILFSEIKAECKNDYERLKILFSR